MSSITFQQTISADFSHHVRCVFIRQRSHSKLNIAENLDVNSTEAEPDEGTEQRIVCHTDHQFNSATDHRLNQYSIHIGQLAGDTERFSNVLKGGSNRLRVFQIESYRLDFGFMDDAVRCQFHGDRESDPLSYCDRLVSGPSDGASCLR